MGDTIISKSQFKPQALHYLRLVENKKQSIIITHNNKPVAKVIPFTEESDQLLQHLRGTVKKYTDPTKPVGESEWEASK